MARARPHSPARIVRNPRICGGEPTIDGTRIPVRCIVVEHQLAGDVDSVLRAYPNLDPATIQFALAYYEAHRAEIDRLIEENEQGAYTPD